MIKILKRGLAALLITVLAAIGFCACEGNNSNKPVTNESKSESETESNTDSDSESQAESVSEEEPPECYYGCPNSTRIKKLNLKKKKIK